MATKKSNEYSESENDISTNELIRKIQIIANSTQIPSESESEVDEEAWLSYMQHLKKNILKESSPIEKQRKHLDELTVNTDEELMLKNQNFVSEFDDEDPDELIQEMEKHLNESFFSAISANPQGSSSPKDLTHQKRNNADSLYETMSSRIFNSEDNSLVNRSESLGYHSFKPVHKNHLSSFSNIMDKLESNTFNKINQKTDSITDTTDSEENEKEDTKSSPIVISLLSSSDEDEEVDHNLKSFEDNEFNESKTDEISFKLKNLKVAAIKPNVITESKENKSKPASVKIISNDLISNTINDESLKNLKTNLFKPLLESNKISNIFNDESLKNFRSNPFKQPLESNKISNIFNDESLKNFRSNPFKQSLESNNNPFQPSLESNNTSVKISRKKKRKLRRQRKKAALKKEQQNFCITSQNTERSPETEIELPSGKRTKIDDKGKFLLKTPELIKVNNEKRRNKSKYLYIKFIPGGIVQFGAKNNNINITNQLKLNQKDLTDNKEYKNELAKMLNTIGGEIILKLGYEVGKGLGKTLQGIQRPIEAYIRKGRGSIGKYGSEMLLPTSIKVQEKQYKILKALGKSELDLEENKTKKKKEPGIYSAVYFDYSKLYSDIENVTENNNEIMVDPLSNEKYSNIVIQFHNDNIENNNNDEKSLRQSNQLKKIRKIINCELLQLCIFDEFSHLYSYQLQELKNNLEKLIINAAMHCNINCLQFESCYIDNTNGCLLLNCTNEITYDWVEKLLITSSMQNFLPNVNLVIKNFRKSLPLTYKMEIFIPGENLMTIEYLKILENQNPGLKTKKWKIYKRNDLRNSVNLILGITEESYKVLEFNYNFRPYLGLGRIKFYSIDI